MRGTTDEASRTTESTPGATRIRSGMRATIACCTVAAATATIAHGQTIRSAQAEAFLSDHCLECHAGETPEVGFDLETLSVDLTDAEVRRRWVHLYDRVAAGEMPPESAGKPDMESKETFLNSLSRALTHADLADREVVLRRLNRNEYANTLSDLFGVHVDVSRILIDDATETGFDNIGSELSVSAEQMELYVEAADLVLDQLFGPAKPPRLINRTANFATTRRGAGESERKLPDGVVLFSGAKYLPLYDMSVPAPGLYRVSVQIRAEQSEVPVVMHVKGGNTGRIAAHSAGFFEALPGRTTTIEFTDRAREKSDNLSFGLIDGFPSWSVNQEEYDGPGLFVGDVTIEGPVDESTPARTRLMGDVDPAHGTIKDIRSILGKTIPRAFRRPVSEAEIAPYSALAESAINKDRGFEPALRLAVKGVLCAPEFLYLEEPTVDGRITAHALASRLSYFLWSSLPDSELSGLADRGVLYRSDVLRSQVERMLLDPKADRFVENFTGQWLRLRDVDFTVPDRVLYPEYDPLLRQSMLDETRAFFREILDRNLSVQNFIDSEFLTINEPLAEFYGINGVKGLEIRRVERPAGSVRGGVLTQASVLKVSADGTRTSPVLRGAWILNHLFGTPSPPPPSTVSTAEPDVRGATTIREVLARHRADESCNRCHRRIDPPGFALESFDVLGGRRDWYRTRDRSGQYLKLLKHPFSTATVQYRRGPDVDPSGTMPDGRAFADVREYKRMLLADETAMARALTRLLMSYSFGRRLGFSDRPEVERILAKAQAEDYGLRSIIHEIVQSSTFRQP